MKRTQRQRIKQVLEQRVRHIDIPPVRFVSWKSLGHLLRHSNCALTSNVISENGMSNDIKACVTILFTLTQYIKQLNVS